MRTINRLASIALAAILLLLTFSSVQPVSSRSLESPKVQNGHYPYVPDVILMEVQGSASMGSLTGTDSTALNAILKNLGMRSVKLLFPSEQAASQVVNSLGTTKKLYRIQLGSGTDVMSAVETLTALPEVVFAEPDYIAHPSSAQPLTINDPLYAQQWGMAKINIEGAWSSTYGSPTVSIAIIDSGIDLTHVDLADNLWVNPGEIASNGLDDDSNGFIDDVNGWNFVSANSNVSDDGVGHGTLVSGVAAAVGGNGQGIVGVCPQCSIMTVKVMQASGTANYSDVAAGILYAAQKGAKVINLSLGGYANSNILKNAIDTAVNTYGVVIVAGAGNDNLTTAFYPAAYDNVLAVAGIQSDDTKVGTSNYASWVDVSAPGINIRTTALGGGWVDNSGTSFSAPFASGLAGLLRTLHPSWSQATIRSQIVQTTDNINGVNPTFAGLLGSGRINAGSAMQTPHPILQVAGYSVNGLDSGRPVLGTTSSMLITLNNDWWDSPNVTGTLSTADPNVSVINGSASFGTIPAGTSSISTTAFTFSVNNSAGNNHPISFNLAVADSDGYVAVLNFTVNTETGVTNKSGTIIANEVWTNDKTYLIVGNVGIAPGVTLTIQPGTTVKFNGNYSLNIGGTLIADGTSSQPIQFKSNTAGTWDKINFDDQSVDALADVNGSYTSGSILRHVNIEGAGAGIACITATPYLAHVALISGGINCSLGATTLWLMDNSIPGVVAITGSGNAYRNTVSTSLSVSEAGVAEDNVVHGTLSLGSGIARRNTVGGLTIGGSGGTLDTNIITGNVSLGDSFNVVGNTITGSLTTGNSATVDHNTVSNGISVGSSATVTWNNVENASGTGLTAGDTVTAQYNRLIGNAIGMIATDGLIEHNLIANNTGVGLQVGAATVQFNTVTGNQGNAIVVQSGTPTGLTNNNLEGNTGTFDLYINIPSVVSVPAQNNWWGTTDTTAIGVRIFDYLDDFNKGQATFSPILGEPDQTAPGYVRNVTVLPDTTLGIQTGTFEAQFSRPMDTNNSPAMLFNDSRKGTWSQYTSSNSPINERVDTIAIEANGTKWFGTNGGGVLSFDGTNWATFNTSNSGLPSNFIQSIAIEPNGTKWFLGGNEIASFDGIIWNNYDSSNFTLPPGGGLYKMAIEANGTKWFVGGAGIVISFDGVNWKTYDSSVTGIPSNPLIAIAIEPNGIKWFGSIFAGVYSFDGTTSKQYIPSNSGLPGDTVRAIVIENNGTKWFGSGNLATSFDGTNWTVYNLNSLVNVIAVESNGTKWFGTNNGVTSFDGTTWSNYSTSNSGLLSDRIWAIATEANNTSTKWFSLDAGVSILYSGDEYPISDNQQWTTSSHYRATYDITSVIPKGTYRVSLSKALDSDGMRVAPFSNSTFVVDYAGAISDTTPPLQPNVVAIGNGSLTTLSANWSSSDPQSPITQYRYAIGTTLGGRDIVNWTYTNATTMIRNNLKLVYGIAYYVSVGARNEGGLWSDSGVSGGITVNAAGGNTTGVFRPSSGLLYLKNQNTTGFADVAINYGIGGDYPIAGDWDGNGTATIGIYRDGSFYLRNSNTLGFADIVFAFGTPGDQPIAGDWNGDGIDSIGVYSNGQFLLRNNNSAGPADMSFYLGNPGDVGIAGDWDGDGSDTTGVFRPSNGVIFLKNANTSGFADVALNYGLAGDQPVIGDWNNDGIDTIGVYRNAQFMLRNSNTIGFAEIVFALGNPGDMPISGNWDGIP